MAESIATEGRGSDALGNYTISQDGALRELATPAPLHSDALMDYIPGGWARSAGIEPSNGLPSPRSATEEGADLSREPEPAAEESEATSGHGCHDDSGH